MNPIYVQLGIALLLELARRRAIKDNDEEGKQDVAIAAFNGLLLGHKSAISSETAEELAGFLADVVEDLLKAVKGE